jgi:hypothetical protein
MGISGCTSCQAGGAEALKAYDQVFQIKRDREAREVSQAVENQQSTLDQAGSENRPIANSTVGSVINIST